MQNLKISEREERLKKLEELKKVGINPYPASTQRTHLINEVLTNFEKLTISTTNLILSGRLRSVRGHGNLTFISLEDGNAHIQAALSKKEIGDENYKQFIKLIDVGDFIELTGVCFLTHANEKSLMVKSWKLLSKALRPLPDKWHGLVDEDERMRKRYLDILTNPETKEMFEKKFKFWQTIRQFLIERGFMEVETPVLENITGGADARPFITHHNALDINVYLRISAGELWQKQLMVAGFEKTFEIGRIFRNEGMSQEHLQDYTQLEFYWAYADYNIGMKTIEELYKKIAQEVFGSFQFKIRDFEIDLNQKWDIYDFVATIQEKTGINILKTDLETIEKKLKELNINYDLKGFNLTRAIDNLWKYCRKQIGGPGFLINVPVSMEPLAKRDPQNPETVQRFQVILAGSEMGKGFSELNDPLDQAERFEEQAKLRESGDNEAQMYNYDFVEALEYGMPPTFGFGVSERLFSFLMNKPVRECQIFPLMRPKN